MQLRKHPFSTLFIGLFLSTGLLFGNTLQAKTDQKQQETLPYDDVQRFTTAFGEIKNFYVKDVNDKELFANAIRGMLQGLDPHSAYLDAEDYKDLQVDTSGKFGGLGIELTMEDGFLKVISPLDGTPSQKAGIKAGDLIIRLDDVPISGMSLRDAVNKMRGPKGSTITLTIYRKGEKEPLKISVVRDIIKVSSIKSKMLDNDYGYIQITQFQAPTKDNLVEAINSLEKQANGHLKGIVLDLRNNPGGLLDSAVEVADIFLDSNKTGHDDLIVYTKGRIPGSQFKATATPGDMLNGAPMVVLTNQGSASAAEIVAGALQDQKRALIIGMPTFGKGSVQTVFPLDDKRAIKLTTAFYYTPAGRSIQAEGIKPDIVVLDHKINDSAKNDEKNMDAVKEANLIGHLKNVNGDKTITLDTKSDALVATDFQLYQAFNVLQGMNVVMKNK